MSNSCSQAPDNTYPSDCQILEGYRTMARNRNGEESDPRRKIALDKAKAIKLLLLDVDGVLTDGTLHYTGTTEESKSFNTQDGFGLRLLREGGIEAGIITARESAVVKRRAEELKMEHIYQGMGNKNEAFKAILKITGLKPVEIAYMGDDWLDLGLLQRVGLALSPANGVREVRDVAHFVTPRAGGMGAVRDACCLILEAQNLLEELLKKYRSR